jgi:hypothetical protein
MFLPCSDFWAVVVRHGLAAVRYRKYIVDVVEDYLLWPMV